MNFLWCRSKKRSKSHLSRPRWRCLLHRFRRKYGLHFRQDTPDPPPLHFHFHLHLPPLHHTFHWSPFTNWHRLLGGSSNLAGLFTSKSNSSNLPRIFRLDTPSLPWEEIVGLDFHHHVVHRDIVPEHEDHDGGDNVIIKHLYIGTFCWSEGNLASVTVGTWKRIMLSRSV